jgi:hypothetical protein
MACEVCNTVIPVGAKLTAKLTLEYPASSLRSIESQQEANCLILVVSILLSIALLLLSIKYSVVDSKPALDYNPALNHPATVVHCPRI